MPGYGPSADPTRWADPAEVAHLDVTLEPVDNVAPAGPVTARRSKGEGSLYQRANGIWAATVELDPVGGKRRRQVVYAKTKPELARKLRAAQERREQGRPILDARRTTGDFLAYWASDILPGTISDNTLQGYRHIVRRDITPYIGHIPLAQLRPEHVHVMLRTLEVERGLAPRTVSYARAVLRRALRLAERWDMVTRNAAALVDAPRQRRRQPDHLPLEDVQKILQAAPADRLGALYVLAVTCGLRRGELLALLWEDVDLDEAVVHVRAGLKRIAGQGLVRDEPKTAQPAPCNARLHQAEPDAHHRVPARRPGVEVVGLCGRTSS